MSKIERYQGNLRAFASGAEGLERTLFGSAAQADDLTSQVTAAFLRGWGIVGASEYPSLEDFNGAMYAMSQFLAYQHQVGVPEWHEDQEYYIGSICTHHGESYQSLTDANVGNEPPSEQWTPILTAANGLNNIGLNIQFQMGANISIEADEYGNIPQQDGMVMTSISIPPDNHSKIQATFQPIQVKLGDGDWQDLKTLKPVGNLKQEVTDDNI
ncbi:phage tail fiber C-terminal domain-containing protein [Salmonella enterica subsp. salamae]|uniref:Phage tail fiber C-terminal domain-containing protein n=2 Tax=Salmonella enterica TaxID=28901 RepID=A0A8F7U9R2_SALER|nr:phage tail fiber C-terminal domain-containing protein [Salmonella enterica]QXX11734.1 phage tail fiber C-terminal domain-containing protein [Salmonella enterica]QXX17559.1 phage tail fiber C-terminal domain-containing protein [Salmonella enterica subsp. salamae]